MPSEQEEIKQIFNNFGITLSTEWLESCIEWCKSDNLPLNYTLRNLQNMVYEQWLILDLNDVQIRSLPRNLSSEKKYSLTGVYYLQVMQVIDISKPKLWQLQRIRNNVAKNTDSETEFGKRVLQLTLTDGVEEVQAMEFKPIPCLNINLSPGTKVKIIGPTMIRNGRLMLEPENIKNLGGSVDDLSVKYAAENVLARALGLEENPSPHIIDEKILEVTQANSNTQQNTSAFQNPHAQNRYQNQSRNIPPNQNPVRNNQNISMSNRTNTNKIILNQEIPPEFEVDDELLRELEEDFEENSVNHYRNSMTQRTSTQSSNFIPPTNNLRTENSNSTSKVPANRDCSSPDLFEEMEFDEELLNEHLDQIGTEYGGSSTDFSNNITKKLESISSRGRTDQNWHKHSEDTGQSIKIIAAGQGVGSSSAQEADKVITLDDSFDDIDIDSHLDHIDQEMANLPCSTQKVRDFKEQVKSPELKRPTSTPKLTLSKPLASKKLAQSKLTFFSGNSTENKKLLGPSKQGLHLHNHDEDLKNPFSIFAHSAQKQPPASVPLDIPGVVKKTPYNPAPLSGLSSKTSIPSTSKNPPSLSIASNEIAGFSSSESAVKNSPGRSFIYVVSIEKLKTLLPNISNGKFKIKAKLKSVEKFRVKTDTYLALTVLDDTGELIVEVHPDIVARFAQMKGERFVELRELVAKNDENAQKELEQALGRLHSKLVALDDVLELRITRGEKYPIVIKIL